MDYLSANDRLLVDVLLDELTRSPASMHDQAKQMIKRFCVVVAAGERDPARVRDAIVGTETSLVFLDLRRPIQISVNDD